MHYRQSAKSLRVNRVEQDERRNRPAFVYESICESVIFILLVIISLSLRCRDETEDECYASDDGKTRGERPGTA